MVLEAPSKGSETFSTIGGILVNGIGGIGGWFENAGLDTAAFFATHAGIVRSWMEDAAANTINWVVDDFVSFVSVVGAKVGDWLEDDFVTFFESDIADFFTEDVASWGESFGMNVVDTVNGFGNDPLVKGISKIGQSIGKFFAEDFADWFAGEFANYWVSIYNIYVNMYVDGFKTIASGFEDFGKWLAALGSRRVVRRDAHAAERCTACRASLEGSDVKPMETCYLPIPEAVGGAEGSTTRGYCNTETAKFANEDCLQIDEACSDCYDGESECIGSTESYDPVEWMCTESANAASVAACFRSSDSNSTGFCDADRKAFGYEACHKRSTDPNTGEEGKSITEVCAKYYPDSACTDCSGGTDACVPVTATYDVLSEACTADDAVAKCFASHVSDEKGLCHAQTGLFLDASCLAVVKAPTQCGKFFAQSPCTAAKATVSDAQMAEYNQEQLCAPDGLCAEAVSNCYVANEEGVDGGLCHATTGLFLSLNCKRATRCGVCFPESACSEAVDVTSWAARPAELEKATNDRWCDAQCSGVSMCWTSTEDDAGGFCNSDTGFFLSGQCTQVAACSGCFPDSPCVDAIGTGTASALSDVEELDDDAAFGVSSAAAVVVVALIAALY
jgi:hypothetical protein